jgi:hypothetical protein
MLAVHPYLYQCPTTGAKLRAESGRAQAATDTEVLEPVWCLACGKMHLVNPATGRVGIKVTGAEPTGASQGAFPAG